MKKLKKDELAKSVKKFLRKKKLKASDYESEFVEKTCALITTAFNKTYDVSNSAIGSIEEQVGKIHDAIFREEEEAKTAAKPSAKKSSSKKATKKAKKASAKKTTKKPAAKKTTKAVTKKAAKKAVKKATSPKASKKAAKKATKKAPVK